MAVSVSRLTLAALSAVVAATAFTTPAGAAAYGNGISVREEAHLNPDNTVTLSGTYRCAPASPVGTVQISATLIQEGTRLTFGGDQAPNCDGEEHEWTASGTLRMTPGVHPGAARAETRLQRVGTSGTGLIPRAVHASNLAEDGREVTLSHSLR
ncbi:DUF6299 family protein [Streptomyces sp. NPDC048606]|uniref:DUF6299 family protein n=1 Tax=Streptomyces sp. NPDC048606 TaxID=3154726 RepID=UPI003449A336